MKTEYAMDKGEKPVDPRVTRTRAAIKQAFGDMVIEMDVERISVKALASRAGINRKTFYLHYGAIEQLYDEVVNDVLDDYFEHYETTVEVPEDFAGHAIRFFRFLAGQPERIERLVCSFGPYDFGERIYLGQMERYRNEGSDPFNWLDPVRHDLVLCFIRSTALDFYRRWVAQGKRASVDEAAALLSELTCNGVSNLSQGRGA